MNVIAIERLGAWVGRTESRSDVVTAWPAVALSPTFDRSALTFIGHRIHYDLDYFWTANSAGNYAMAGTAYF